MAARDARLRAILAQPTQHETDADRGRIPAADNLWRTALYKKDGGGADALFRVHDRCIPCFDCNRLCSYDKASRPIHERINPEQRCVTRTHFASF